MGVKQLFSIVALGLLAVASRARGPKREHMTSSTRQERCSSWAPARTGHPPSQVAPELVAAHCRKVHTAQDGLPQRNWLGVANEFFREHVPARDPQGRGVSVRGVATCRRR